MTQVAGLARNGSVDSLSTHFVNPLPGGEPDCLGSADQWPESLREYVVTAASFTYPAAIFWSQPKKQELVPLCNRAWLDAGGVERHSALPKRALDVLRCLINDGKVGNILSWDLLQCRRGADLEPYRVLISPIYGNATECHVHGALLQLLPRTTFSEAEDDFHAGKRKQSLLSPAVSQYDDTVPLDEHPFFRKFAEMLPSGLAILDHRAQAVFVNQHFYELTTQRNEDDSFKFWPQSIHPDDYERVMEAYHEAFSSQKQLRTEFRAQGVSNAWRLLLLTPLGDENLRHVSLREYGGFLCSIVDISSEKSAELAERKAAEDARQRRDQQERFIDMISHEIRNPLSAVLHCSEDIQDAVRDPQNVDPATILEAVETINLCISHQRIIVDDVLSFSKLDASMLNLTPRPCQPGPQLGNSLKMFQSECRKQSMEFEYCIDSSYEAVSKTWVMADLARITQVLINLVSNSIKFTARSDGEKKVMVSLGASYERPTSYPPNLVFFSADELAYRLDATNTTNWGNGQALYLMVAVKDTGIGISEEGQKRLFERFRQATPKTGEIYGGSGLGLNISRKICHLHGGEIGVSSRERDGSTFGFFFKVRRSEQSAEATMKREDDGQEDEQIRSQVRALMNTPPGSTDPKLLPASLPSPTVVRMEAQVPHSSGGPNDRCEEKSADASQTKGSESEPHSDSERPNFAKEQQEGKGLHAGDHISTTARVGPSTAPDQMGAHGHVLLVEDNIINQRIVSRKLQSKGYTVSTANNGREAVDAVRSAATAPSGDRSSFDIILMDQEMPVMDGNAATKAIRELEMEGEIARVPILGVTANVRGAQQDEMMTSGMDGVISKPYRINDMVSEIKRITRSIDRDEKCQPVLDTAS